MANILYLVHRLPYPPNKGDKVRSFHLLKHLAARHRVFLGTFVDDPEDMQFLETVRPFCVEMHAVQIDPRWGKLSSLRGLMTGEALSLPFYRDAGMREWVRRIAGAESFDASVVFSSPMAQYAMLLPDVPMLVDFVDLDSAKWTDYAPNHVWPMSWLYRREGQFLLDFEQQVAARARASFFVTDKEVDLFLARSPGHQAPVQALGNGVDADFFAPDAARPSPFPSGQLPLVFTGAMDYWPNIDAVSWFATDVLPTLRERWPAIHFYIVGRSPSATVEALASDGVSVTGTVPDVRPYLQHAALVVAPLRLARGIQNKILEAMAMGRPVIASRSCVQAIEAQAGQELIDAESSEDFVREVSALLTSAARAEAMGAAGRERVLASYSWDAHLAGIDRHLAQLTESSVSR
ncbi:TIGR03087 family PEP-CTERM/XrtA system glycosyltransferase [Paucibacter sp. Y2R2-4]|uniref:TIGR03087 family PEP-CTERM/XrtA system glycosyltransferase n=1 Tax=Paucibacter sp. Y2R2-4 TaxID=2893553 RepID=UPI0021E3B85F|nr:TIGR03087 family PEP-CTERM/XrtA system glycosyltransferase [Paucibacter sp. Y2R2-4]MCV2348573.1 TIGR03087 family PEP-CTERM/XrtA system glycosyltransferase [Paucibacter sp. Y2R2-4]